MVQSNQISREMLRHGIRCELVQVESQGDQDRTKPLYSMESSPGLFTKQLEDALLKETIDLAVHSLKDLPTDQPKGLFVAAVPPRVNANDCLIISQQWHAPNEKLQIKKGATVGTSSLRREALLLSERSDVSVFALRGNVPTRVKAVREGKVAAVVLAEAGISRLGLDLSGLIKVELSPEVFVSAPGQGALAVESRENLRPELEEVFQKLTDANSVQETRMERQILKGLHGGCTLPLGVRCHKDRKSGLITVRAFLGLLRDKGSKTHDWTGFHRFDISGSEEQTLVDQTVSFFKEVMA